MVDQLVKNGANVVAVSRSAGPLEALKKEWPRVETIQLDISDWKQTKELLGKVGSLDGLVNNAGVAIIKSIEEFTEEDFDNTVNVNLKGQFVVTQTLLPKLKDGASIVNISSLAGLKAFPDHSVYSMTKAGLDAFTRSLALELGPRKIRVNSLNPTVILTRMGKDNWSDPKKADPLLSKIPLRRFGEVKEVVDPILFLLSDRSSYINGQMLPVEGGFLAGQ